MNNSTQLLILISISLLSSSCFADDKQKADSKKRQKITDKEKTSIQNKKTLEIKSLNKITYIPPFLGAPSTNRLHGMGVRSADKQIDLLFSVLTPAHTGLTSQPQPHLFWFTSSPIPKYFQFIEFVLNSEESISPLVRIHLPRVKKPGFHRLDLADYNISLKPGVEYWWSIALVKNAEARSNDLVSSGKIKYLKADEQLQLRIQQLSAGEKAAIYAQTGYWYEAFAAAIELQNVQPNDLIDLINKAELQIITEYLAKVNQGDGQKHRFQW